MVNFATTSCSYGQKRQADTANRSPETATASSYQALESTIEQARCVVEYSCKRNRYKVLDVEEKTKKQELVGLQKKKKKTGSHQSTQRASTSC